MKAAARFRNHPSQVVSRFSLYYFALLYVNPTKIKIGFDQGAHPSRTIDEGGVTRATRQRFNSYCSRTGAQIEKACSLDSRLNPVAVRRSDPLSRGPALWSSRGSRARARTFGREET